MGKITPTVQNSKAATKPGAKMVDSEKAATRAHRKGFSPPPEEVTRKVFSRLPKDGWTEELGPWQDYVEHCLAKGANIHHGMIFWIKDGVLHREDGPAEEEEDGYKSYLLNGKVHRLDGPAIMDKNGFVEFWKDNIQYTDITFTERVF